MTVRFVGGAGESRRHDILVTDSTSIVVLDIATETLGGIVGKFVTTSGTYDATRLTVLFPIMRGDQGIALRLFAITLGTS